MFHPARLVELEIIEVGMGEIHDVIQSFVEQLIIRDGYNGASLRAYHRSLTAQIIDLDL